MLIWAFLARRLRQWKLYQSTHAELSRLDDRALADLNIRRHDIDFVALNVSRQQSV